MKMQIALSCVLALASVAMSPAHADPLPRPDLLPWPAQVVQRPGEFTLRADTPLQANGAVAERVAEQLRAMPGIHFKLPAASTGAAARSGFIELSIDAASNWSSPEAYVLEIDAHAIRVRAGAEPGLFYGAVTLAQLLGTDGEVSNLRLPMLRIEDAPRFGWRGLLLDSARHFQRVEDIKRLLDAMAQLKLNRFHWHLTDDQGWRIPVPGWPKLITVGACRVPAGDGGVDAATGRPVPYCGHYSEAEIRDIVAYAAARHIEVIPEIDLPGHATAAISAYPQLGVSGQGLPVSNEWGVNVNLFNADESTMQFLEDVFAQVVRLFPGRFVHVGGDEAVKDQWQASPRIQARIRELGVKNEAGLQAWMVARLERFLAGHGKRLIGWDEILDGDLPKGAAVTSWRGTEGGIQAAKRGHDVVMNPSGVLYFDYLQTASEREPPGRPALIPIESVYAFEPVPKELDAEQAKHILGVQANVWTEHMRSFERVQQALFPRAAALAEVAWSPLAARDFKAFQRRLPAQLARWHRQGIAAASTAFEPQIDATPGFGDTVRVSLSQPLGYTLRYTTDGTPPYAHSAEYFAELELPLPAKLSAQAFNGALALVAPVQWEISVDSLRSRSDEALKMCTNQLMLRLEDDGPRLGERAIFNVDIFNPCWLWPGAHLTGINAVEVRAGRIPYFFQLAHDEPHRTFRPTQSRFGEVVLRAGCDGPLLATLPLPEAPDADGFVDLRLPLVEAPEHADLCLWFTGDTRPAMWVLDRIRLISDGNTRSEP